MSHIIHHDNVFHSRGMQLKLFSIITIMKCSDLLPESILLFILFNGIRFQTNFREFEVLTISVRILKQIMYILRGVALRGNPLLFERCNSFKIINDHFYLYMSLFISIQQSTQCSICLQRLINYGSIVLMVFLNVH